MSGESKREPLFPDHGTLIIFIAYIVFFVCQGILVTASRTPENNYDYSTIAAVLACELVKLIISSAWYLKDRSLEEFYLESRRHIKVLGLYFVPATLYCLYNNLAFVNLRNFDPTTYYLLLQLRVVITGLIYQCFFRRQLTAWQWFSLILLTIGCIVKNLGTLSPSNGSTNSSIGTFFHFNLILLLIQVFCSCIAGVYNEVLLKKTGSNLNLMIHNIFMYIDSIICNTLAFICLTGGGTTIDSFVSLFKPTIIAVIINNALCGIVTSFFLKKLNSILKTFASALDLVATALLCWFIFSIPIDLYTVLSIIFVSYATCLYFKHPLKLDTTSRTSSPQRSKRSTPSLKSSLPYFQLKDLEDPGTNSEKAEESIVETV